MKKPIVVWVLIVLVVLDILLELFSVVAAISVAGIVSTFSSFDVIIATISLIILVTYLIKLSRVSKDLIAWTHITFGFYLISIIYTLFVVQMNGVIIARSIVNWVPALVLILLWAFFVFRLRKIQQNLPA